MATIKISELTALTPPDAADLVPVTDSSASQTKRTTVGEIVGIVNGDVDVANDGTATISELPVSKLQDGSSRQLLQTDAAGTGVEWTSNVDVPGTLDVTDAATFDSTATVTGVISANGKVSFPLGSAAAPSLYPSSDTDTGIYSPGADQLALASSGVQRANFGTSEVVFNDGGENYDFRIEGDTEANLLFVDASTNRVGVGTSSPSSTLDVAGRITTQAITSSTSGYSSFTRTGTEDSGGIVEFLSDSGSRLKIQKDGKVGIGDTGPSETLTVKGASSVDPFSVSGPSSEFLRVDDSGRLLVGTSSSASIGGLQSNIQAVGAGAAAGSIGIRRDTNDTGSPYLSIGKSRGSGSTVVLDDDPLGEIRFSGADGTDTDTVGAAITAYVDGTPGANDMPGRLVFSSTPSGSATPVERMRIDNAGQTVMTANISSNYATTVINDGNNANRYGLKVQCGADDAAGTNYAVSFNDGNDTNQGYITFSGGTVTYGTFTAYHPCILPDVDDESGYPYGTLLEIISLEYTQKDGQDTERGILYNVRKTQAANSRAILGAYGSSMNGGPDGAINRHQALVLGDGHILCNNSGGNIKVGDGICSSAAPGIGQKATAAPSMIIGIAQEDITFDSDEVKLVPVQYGLQQFIPWQD